MKSSKIKTLFAAVACTLIPAVADAGTCRTYASNCARVEQTSRLACALMWYDNDGARGTSACKSALDASYYSACTNVPSACSTSTAPSMYDQNTKPGSTSWMGRGDSGTVVTETCPTGHFVQQITVRYGAMNSLSGSRIGYFSMKCSNGTNYNFSDNNTQYGQFLICNTGQFVNTIKGYYNGSYMTSLSGDCRDVASASPTSKYMSMVGTNGGSATTTTCNAGTYAYGLKVRINTTSTRGDRHVLGLQLLCERFSPV